jgi:polysaccharide export outer membrane protein
MFATHKPRGLLKCLLPVVLSLLVAAQVPEVTTVADGPGAPDGKLVICGGDLLHLTVLGAPDFERDVRVSDSGQISLPMVGDILVAGLGATEAQRLIAKKLLEAKMFVDPQVTLSVKEYATLGVAVLGEVQKPGTYPLLGSHTLYDAISAAGGTTAKAGRAVTISHRNAPGKTETVIMTNSPDGHTTGNVPILPGDTIVVCKAGMVYVVGEVRQPTGIILDNPGLTVLQAIAIAQGTNINASLDNAKVLRKTGNDVEQIPVPLKQMLAAKKADVPLQPEDVLFVPTSTAKSAARRSMEAILQAATGVVIYRR